jgi:serine/threonine-protein kinase
MGVVWLAEDGGSDGRTQVALKFAHMAQRRPDLPARMAREQQLLAALDHPNIARMYDAGVTPEGQPYLVLEYVRGQVLDAYCSSHKPSLEQRLELFIQIASAVAHAHARQIVHRDLKPANVMVTSDGTARLLDFGIGKLLTEGMPAEFQLTLMAGQPLTPAYASPEQIAGGTVGFPTDIYSLGVMFYELLVGVRPYIYKRGSNRALREAILEATPIVPSAATDDVALRARLQGELDVAVLRALRKQPEARHASVQAFVDAVEHARAR